MTDIEASRNIIEKEDQNDVIDYNKYIETPWTIIASYLENQHLERLVRHQLESYNNFVGYQIIKTIEMFNPVHIKSENDFDAASGKYSLEMFITFENFNIYRPQIYENNGSIKLMFPQAARLRNFTYASAMTIDMKIQYIIRNGENLCNTNILYKILPKIHIGKLPIMLKSNICVLNQYKYINNNQSTECAYDTGGYFIINGSEKTVLAQERAAENKVYCFNVAKNNPKYLWTAEIKSIPDFKCISPKQINMYLVSRDNGFGYPIVIQIPRVKQPVPLFVVFRALGIISDKAICEYILLKSSICRDMLELLQASIVESNKMLTQEDALKFMMSNVMYTPMNMDKETGQRKKMEFTQNVLENDLFPHCATKEQKIYFLGYMTNKLLKCYFELTPGDDRDSYVNKRIDLTGSSLNNLFRNYFNKLVKDMEKFIIKEINTGSWRSREDYMNIINLTNIYKIIKSTTIENGLKRALSTGDFGIKQTNSNKVGVAQVLSRLTYPATLSHLRRISTPIDKSGKLVPPRKLHNSSWGYMCPAETPEGQSVGVVKNLSYMAHITIQSDSKSLYEYVKPYIISLSADCAHQSDETKVFINGCWIGTTENPIELYTMCKDMKCRGIINIYTAVIFDYCANEIRLCNEAGRVMRPLLRVKNGQLLLTNNIVTDLQNGLLSWNDLFTNCKIPEAVLEYIDAEEQNFSLIAMKPADLLSTAQRCREGRYTHCEIHPSTIFGIVASCIPFPESNQSPRNTYQCAQAKQAMGIYATNYNERMDKTAYVLTYPTRPLVDTRIMNLIRLNEIPSGCNITVAIMTHTGYNQEDSILINGGSIDRGLFQAVVYHTEKDEDKQKINGDEEVRCKPNKAKTKGMKYGNYDKVNARGVIPENTLVENRDIIIAKVIPIKENRNDHTKIIKFEDESRIYRTTEETYIDKNYIDRNGDGYTFAKVRLRILRKPVIGDKFCLTDDHDVLTLNRGWVPICNIMMDDKVAQLNRETNTLEYVHPLEVMQFDHEGDMYQVETDFASLCTTWNHRMWVRVSPKFRFHQPNDSFELVEAKHVAGRGYAFEYQNGGVPYAKLDENPNSEKSISDDNIWSFITRKLCGWSEIPNECLELPGFAATLNTRQLRYMLQTLCGGNSESEYLEYTTKSIKLRDQIQIAALHCGYTARFEEIKEEKEEKETEHRSWEVIIDCKRPYSGFGRYDENPITDFRGKVYCIRVPSEVFLVRRNGRCVFTGNSSRHGQKGTIGNIIPEEDMPFNSNGDRPDIIINPHAIPSRMTIGQLKETLLGKVLIQLGLFGDGTAFGDLSVDTITRKLLELGYESNGNEVLYNGLTGEQIECNVFMGPVFYQRLKHMVNDKRHSRAIGPMVNLTRQPAEGRSRDGGLRFGEMERDAMVSHGASRFTRERMYDVSDKYQVHACKCCGMIAAYNDAKHIHHCRNCDNRAAFTYVELPYACKLLFQELMTMNVVPRMITE